MWSRVALLILALIGPVHADGAFQLAGIVLAPVLAPTDRHSRERPVEFRLSLRSPTRRQGQPRKEQHQGEQIGPEAEFHRLLRTGLAKNRRSGFLPD